MHGFVKMNPWESHDMHCEERDGVSVDAVGVDEP